MKGISGIIVAVGLGIAGALANFYYLHSEAQKVDTISFIGVKKGVIIGRGERLLEENLVEVKIPKNHVGNLDQYACLWKELVSVKDVPIWQAIDSRDDGALLLRTVLKTPPKELELGKGEMAACIAVPKSFVTSHVNPGDRVWFKFVAGASSASLPTPAAKIASVTSAAEDLQPKQEDTEAASPPAAVGEVIGPFVIKSIGNRLGTAEVMRAAKIPQVQENILVIRVSKNVPGEQESYDKLCNRIHTSGANSYEVLHGKE